MSDLQRSLATGFLNCAERFADRPALAIAGQTLTYVQLKSLAARIAGTLQRYGAASDARLTGVFGHRSVTAFAGVLAALFDGDAYVPLNPVFPAGRTLQMIERSRLDRIVVESASFALLIPVLAQIDRPLCVLVADAADADRLPQWPDQCDHHQLLTATDLVSDSACRFVEAPADALAYLLFTSGSTGLPKGVMVTQQNVLQFVDVMVARYGIDEHDRFSQTFDLTFDLSAFDMFVAWERGACVCCPTPAQKLLPSKYITAQGITVWFSVPSTAILMKKLRMLKPAQYPTLRYALFCGEALPLEVAEAFQLAAPGATVENLYGPTELTIACAAYTYDRACAAQESELGVVPIGWPYPGMQVLIVDDDLRPVASGESGELLMTGPQLTSGYWDDAEKTSAAFVVPPGETATYYRTGDRVKCRTAGQPLLYLGRVDSQIKVQGYRVELGEIEALMRAAAKVDVAVALGHPMSAAGAQGIVAFVGESEVGAAAILETLREQLPPYMQPSDLVPVSSFPLNANGKVDRRALLDRYLAADRGQRATA